MACQHRRRDPHTLRCAACVAIFPVPGQMPLFPEETQMICTPCQDRDHGHCDDLFEKVETKVKKKGKPAKITFTYRKREGRLYRSCDCQHVGTSVADEVLADPTDY